jgi:hypothetical protein
MNAWFNEDVDYQGVFGAQASSSDQHGEGKFS